MKTFKILHAPLHGNSATNREMQRALRRPGVVGVVFTEAYRHGPFLKSRPRWRATMGGTKRNARGTMVARDVAVLVRRWRKPLDHWVIKGSAASTPLKIAPERFITVSVDNLWGSPLAIIGLHPHAAVRNSWGSDRAAKYRDYMREVHETVRDLRFTYGDDLDIVITGDLQYTAGDPVRDWSPRDLFNRLDMHVVATQGLDWVAVSDGLHLVDFEVITTGANGQDHPWLEVELERIR